MARPRRWYCVFDMGRVVAIINCSIEARRRKAAKPSFSSRLAAEEFAAWWSYERPPWWERPSTTERTFSPRLPSP